ncbi:nucleotide exchange factor GrpE [Picosynechococcus sp. NKBG15041c]|uniref:nucleotide exchange factor GrpE n=1 Tax=Picosynechococcus sp. NKBG15041c TaxID=1407650 RepID=UPI00040F3D70|nr:nucleotide exchange factor GrpE [Picosynechococcus sp. NKBG15041c]
MSHPHAAQLQVLMAQANVSDVIQLAAYSQVSARQIYRLQAGLIHSVPVESVVQLAQYFDRSVDEFLALFLATGIHPIPFTAKTTSSAAVDPAELEALQTEGDRLRQQLETQAINHAEEIEQLQSHLQQQAQQFQDKIDHLQRQLENQATTHAEEIKLLKTEYDRLENQLDEQLTQAEQQWQQEALDTLEAWLLQWSAAAKAAQDNPQFPARTIVALTQPFDQLLESWDVSPIGEVSDIVEYDPQLHQLVKDHGDVAPGDLVMVQNVGYRQGDRLLHRAKVIHQEEPKGTEN